MAITSPGVIRAANEVLTDLRPNITALKQFTWDISNEVADYGSKIRVAFVSAGAYENYADDNCATTNSGNFSHATGSLSDTFITLSKQPKVTVPVTQTDALEIPTAQIWSKIAEAGVNAIGAAISTEVGGLFTADNCAGGKVVLASGFGLKDLAKLRSKSAARAADTVLVLAPDYFEEALALAPANVYGNADVIQNGVIEKLFGFKAVMEAYDLPDGIKGALVPATSVAVAIRPFAIPAGNDYPEYGIVSDENGFSLTAMRHTDFSTGKAFVNIGCLVGADIIRKASVKYLASS